MHVIKPEGNISVCPLCGYEDGFHVSFHIKDESARADVILICPNCHQRFQMGWQISISKP